MPPSLTIANAVDENYLNGLVGTMSDVSQNTRSEVINTYILDCGMKDTSWRNSLMATRALALRMLRTVAS